MNRTIIPLLASCCVGAVAAETVPPAGSAPVAASTIADAKTIARTGIDRGWTATTIGVSYDATVIDDSDLDIIRLQGRWSRDQLSVWGAYQIHVRSNPDRGATETGVGDAEVGASFALDFSPVLRLTLGAEATLNLAADDLLGKNSNLVRPFVAVSLLADQQTAAAVELGYLFDAGKESGIADTSLVDLRLTGIRTLPMGAFAWARLTPAYDLEREEFNFGISGGVGLLAGQHHTLRLETVQPLDHNSRNRDGWTLHISYNWDL